MKMKEDKKTSDNLTLKLPHLEPKPIIVIKSDNKEILLPDN